MYKFTNGVVVYDEITRDKYIKAGMILVKEEIPKEEEKNVIKEAQSDIKRSEFKPTRKRTERFGKSLR